MSSSASQELPSTLKQSEWRRGWPVLAGTTVALAFGQSLYNYVASLFIMPLQAEFGWTRGQIGSATAMGLVGVFAAPLIGRLSDRIGVRPVATTSFIVLALAYGILAAMPASLFWFYLAIMVLGVAGLGTTGITLTRPVAAWFVRNRALALGLSLTGVSIAAAMMPPVLNWVILEFGWRSAYLLLGALALMVSLPAVLLLVREPPRTESTKREPKLALISRLAQRPAFWLLTGGMILINLPGAGMLSQMQPLLADGGLSASTAASMLSVYAGAILVGRLVYGVLADRVPAAPIAAVLVGAPAIGAFLLSSGAFDVRTAMIAVGLLGLSQGAEMDLTGYFTARHFGLGDYSTVFAFVISALVLANAGGALWFGHAFDTAGNYQDALRLGIGGFLAGALCFLGLTWCAPYSSSQPKETPS